MYRAHSGSRRVGGDGDGLLRALAAQMRREALEQRNGATRLFIRQSGRKSDGETALQQPRGLHVVLGDAGFEAGRAKAVQPAMHESRRA
jgi:hypothetical protein